MSTLDIRDIRKSAIDQIQYDDTDDRIVLDANELYIALRYDQDEDPVLLCKAETFDDFIKAMHKAKELWL